MPYIATDGRRASVTEPDTWSEFAAAASAYAAAGHDGLGFVLTAQDPFLGVDLDGCRDPDTGAIEDWAQEIIDELSSYSEVTPSATGLRVWVKATLPPGGNRRGPIEMYDRRRYFTVTGKHLEGTPAAIGARQREVEVLHRRIFGDAPASRSDAEVLRAARQDPRLSRLLDGDASGYSSTSEADLALVSRLAKLTRDRDQVRRIWLRSALAREKLDREDYVERTLAKALPPESADADGLTTAALGRERTRWSPDPASRERWVAEEALYLADRDEARRRWNAAGADAPELQDLAAEWAEDAQPQARIAGWLPRRALVSLWGEAEAGKSTLAVAAAVEELRAGRGVVFLSAEAGARSYTLKFRLLGATREELAAWHASGRLRFWRATSSDLLADPEFLERECAKAQAAMFVVDSLPAVLANAALDENSAADVRRLVQQVFLRAAHGTGATGLLIDHPGHEDKARPRGTSDKLPEIDFGFKLVAHVAFNASTSGRLSVTCLKARDALHPDDWRTGAFLDLLAEVSGDGTGLRLRLPPKVEVRLRTTRDRIRHALKVAGEPLTYADLARLTGKTAKELSARVKEHPEEFVVLPDGGGGVVRIDIAQRVE